MAKIGFIDISEKPALYVIEKKGDGLELKDEAAVQDYSVSIPEMHSDIGEFHLSMPLSALNFRIIELPFSEKDKILSVLPYELNEIIFSGAESVVFDCVILQVKEGKSRVLAVYVEKNALRNALEKLHSSNIDPKTVTSIELNHVLKDFSPERLLSSPDMTGDERVKASMEEIQKTTVNFRRSEFAYTKDSDEIKRSLRRTVVLAASLFVLFLLFIGLKISSVVKETAFLGKDLKKIYSEVYPEAKNISAGLYQFKAKIKEMRDKDAYFGGISPLNLLLNISSANKKGVLTELTIDRERVTIKGEAQSFRDVQQIKDSLAVVLADLNIADSRTSVQGKVLFTITAREKKN